jgi:hypothetical protein
MTTCETLFVGEDDKPLFKPLPAVEPLNLVAGTSVHAMKDGAVLEFEVVKWRYEIEGERLALIVTLRRVMPTVFQRLTQDQQVALTYALIVLTLIPAGVLAIVYYANQPQFMAFVGWYCRYAVGWCIFVLGALLPVRLPGWTVGKPTVLGTYVGLLLPLVGLLSALAWMQISRPPPELAASLEDSAKYAEWLLAKLNPALPAVLGALPWVAIVVKFVGLKGVGAVFEKLSSVRK